LFGGEKIGKMVEWTKKYLGNIWIGINVINTREENNYPCPKYVFLVWWQHSQESDNHG
jgi:hypothetical protein